jgi:hypothetical protein
MWHSARILSLLVCVLTSLQSSAAPAPGRPPFSLSISLDRASYLSREMIVIECALKHEGPEALYYYSTIKTPVLEFRNLDGQGNPTELIRVGREMPGKPELRTFPPKQTVRTFCELRSDYNGLYGTGKFKIWAKVGVGYSYNRDAAERFHVTLTSNEVQFEIVKPQGLDAEVLSFIEKERLVGSRFRGEEAEDWANGWAGSLKFQEQLFTKYPKSRYTTGAAFFLWHLRAPNPAAMKPPRGTQFEDALPYYKLCQESPHTSPYLKGLAAAQYLSIIAEFKGETHAETLQLAKDLVAKHPNTLIGDRASRFIRQPESPKKRRCQVGM